MAPINPENGTEFPGCNICGETAFALLFAEATGEPYEKPRGIVRCPVCGLVYRNMRNSEAAIRQYYTSSTTDLLSPEWIRGREKVFLPYLKRLSGCRNTNRILDVGAGHGFFLASCRQNGWDCYGLEPSSACRQYAKAKFGIRLDASDITDLNIDGKFDVVTFWNVLDHLNDPKRALQSAFGLLRPGGKVLVRCPNADFHIGAKKLHNRLKKIFPRLFQVNPVVFHLYSFTWKTLSQLLRMTRFEDISIEPATLSWTTSPSAKSTYLRRVTALLTAYFAQGLYSFTGGRLLVSPSIIVIASTKDRKSHNGNHFSAIGMNADNNRN